MILDKRTVAAGHLLKDDMQHPAVLGAFYIYIQVNAGISNGN
jgi:hypothetical protein